MGYDGSYRGHDYLPAAAYPASLLSHVPRYYHVLVPHGEEEKGGILETGVKLDHVEEKLQGFKNELIRELKCADKINGFNKDID